MGKKKNQTAPYQSEKQTTQNPPSLMLSIYSSPPNSCLQPIPFFNLAIGCCNLVRLHIQASKAENWQAPMVPNNIQFPHNTQQMVIIVIGIISSQGLAMVRAKVQRIDSVWLSQQWIQFSQLSGGCIELYLWEMKVFIVGGGKVRQVICLNFSPVQFSVAHQ